MIGIVPVTPGSTYYIRVGGTGGAHTSAFNGGGRFGHYGAGGGGATDIRTVSADADLVESLESRLLVAAGGGGGGGNSGGGDGGAAGMAGADGSPVTGDFESGRGGRPGTEHGGGPGGTGGFGASAIGGPGSPGSLGSGGDSDANVAGGGGGGGGGLYGGGAGGTGGRSVQGINAPGGGGAGGSSLIPDGGTFELASLSEDPYLSLTLIYAPRLSLGAAIPLSSSRALLLGMVDAAGSEVSAYFEYGTTPDLGKSTPKSKPASYLFASAELNGLAEGGTYFYRLVVEAELGTFTSQVRTLTLPEAEQPAARGSEGGRPSTGPGQDPTAISPPPRRSLLRLAGVGRRLDRGGRIAIRMRCAGASRASCRGRVTVRWPGRRVSRRAIEIPAGKARVIRLNAPRSFRRQLARSGAATLRFHLLGRGETAVPKRSTKTTVRSKTIRRQ